jgi:hypothetical protein
MMIFVGERVIRQKTESLKEITNLAKTFLSNGCSALHRQAQGFVI